MSHDERFKPDEPFCPSPSAEFERRARAIKRRHSHEMSAVSAPYHDEIADPDTIDELRDIVNAHASDTLRPLAGDSIAEKFPLEVQRLILDLVSMARRSLKKGDRVDFYQFFRSLREDELQRKDSQKLLFIPRLSIWLSGRQFVYKGAKWRVPCCKEQDLQNDPPLIRAQMSRLDTPLDQVPITETIPFIEILNGIEV